MTVTTKSSYFTTSFRDSCCYTSSCCKKKSKFNIVIWILLLTYLCCMTLFSIVNRLPAIQTIFTKPSPSRLSSLATTGYYNITNITNTTTNRRSIMTTVTYETLLKQNAETSNAIIEYYKESKPFMVLAKHEGDSTIQRDQEDDIKLEKGIDFAKSKGVIDPNYVPEPYVQLDVLGKTPDIVAAEILNKIKENNTTASDASGSVIVLCGLSGTGKGTTVTKLRQKLEDEENKQVVTWSNGNIFRSVTLLAVTWCEQQSDMDGFDKDRALTKENLQSFMSMLSFGKFNGKYDTRIHGLGLDMFVSEVQNTELKSPKVSKNIPTVAEVTQGEVILFAADAVETMGKDGLFVLLEGREQTVNYVRTPHRFTLILSDESLIGKRRAAQRVMAAAASKLADNSTDVEVGKALDECLMEMATEAGYEP